MFWVTIHIFPVYRYFIYICLHNIYYYFLWGSSFHWSFLIFFPKFWIFLDVEFSGCSGGDINTTRGEAKITKHTTYGQNVCRIWFYKVGEIVNLIYWVDGWMIAFLTHFFTFNTRLIRYMIVRQYIQTLWLSFKHISQ